MKIYDISQEVFSCRVYPGDPAPQMDAVMRMGRGDLYNMTAFSMCAHNGTHMDAPFHFLANGKTVEQIPLVKVIGYSYVANGSGDLTAEDAKSILAAAKSEHVEAFRRILLKGDCVVSLEAAQAFADARIDLIGVESQSVGPVDAPMAVHKTLLGANVVLLEGIQLDAVDKGVYFLNAAPINLAGSDGAPCRAILMEL